MKNGMSKLVIIILVILLCLSGAYIVLGPNGYKTSSQAKAFLDDVLELQSTMSYYVGSSYSDAFGVYSKYEILSGKTEEGEIIKDNEDNLLPDLIDVNDTIDYKGNEKAYKLKLDHVKTTLKIDISNYDGITFYIVEGDIIKVVIDDSLVSEWWSSNFDGLKI